MDEYKEINPKMWKLEFIISCPDCGRVYYESLTYEKYMLQIESSSQSEMNEPVLEIEDYYDNTGIVYKKCRCETILKVNIRFFNRNGKRKEHCKQLLAVHGDCDGMEIE